VPRRVGPVGACRARPVPAAQPAPQRDVSPAFGQGDASMRCDQCGNDYDKAFQLMAGGRTWTFDSFECAIQAVAPVCPHCGVRVVGHGVEQGGRIYCCAHCARHEGHTGVKDRG
jgi:hypothetical protein